MEFPTLLYHGTSGEFARKALREGLRPRSLNADAQDEGKLSNPDCVYLTDAYPIHHAALTSARHGDPYAGVLEIDVLRLDASQFRGDESVIEQLNRDSDGIKGSREDRLRHYRGALKNDFNDAVLTLDRMGSVAYHGPIPAEAISRIAILQADPPILPVSWARDISVSVANYHFVWMQQFAVTEWVMNDRWPRFDQTNEIYRFWLGELMNYNSRQGIKVSEAPRYLAPAEVVNA